MVQSFHPREANLLVIDPGSYSTYVGSADYTAPPKMVIGSYLDCLFGSRSNSLVKGWKSH